MKHFTFFLVAFFALQNSVFAAQTTCVGQTQGGRGSIISHKISITTDSTQVNYTDDFKVSYPHNNGFDTEYVSVGHVINVKGGDGLVLRGNLFETGWGLNPTTPSSNPQVIGSLSFWVTGQGFVTRTPNLGAGPAVPLTCTGGL